MTIKKAQVSNHPEPAPTSPGRGRIVVGVDGSPGSLAALRWALSEASLRGVDVHVVGAWEYPGGTNYGTSADDSPGDVLTKAMKAVITAATAPSQGGEAPATAVTASIVQGDAARELQRAADDGDLLVVGSRGHREVLGRLLGSVSQHVVSRARCPVVVVPDPVHLEEDTSA